MKNFLTLILLFSFYFGFNQNAELKEVEIFAAKTKPVATKIQWVDSIIFQNYKNLSLADLLQEQTNIVVKNYGGAGISTLSLRGSNASQTPVLWHGFNIQNSMLGLSDLSTLSNFMFDAVSVQYTPNSGTLGNGPIGGAIILDNNLNRRIAKTNSLEGNLSYGSFNNQGLFAKYTYSKNRIQLQTKLSRQYQANNYSFINESLPNKPIEKLKHAEMLNINAMLDLYYSSKKIKIDAHYWYVNAIRNIPPTLFQQTSVASQVDETHRMALNFKYLFNKSQLVIRNGYFIDRINFTDSIASINGKNKSYREELDISWRKSINNKLYLETGSNLSLNILESNSYIKKTLTQPRGALYLLVLKSFGRLFTMSANIRAEAIQGYAYQPLTGALGAKTLLSKRSHIEMQSSRNFRYPTFNDFYWQPGGNPNLKPEYSFNNEITWHQGIDSAQNYFFEITVFHKRISNYIQWTPTAQGYWIPENALRVSVTGGEFNFKGATKLGSTTLKFIFNYGFTQAINKEESHGNSNSLGKQLIYVPPHKLNFTTYYIFKKVILIYNLNFLSYRFITSDNTDYLRGFTLHNLKAGYDKKTASKTINLSCSVNNIFNKNYLVVAARPMPRRAFMVGVSFGL